MGKGGGYCELQIGLGKELTWLRPRNFMPSVFALLVACMIAAPGEIQAQSRYPTNRPPIISGGSLALPGAVENIPHLEEIGWDTDLPFLFAIRFVRRS